MQAKQRALSGMSEHHATASPINAQYRSRFRNPHEPRAHAYTPLEPICRTCDPLRRRADDVRVRHRRPQVAVPEQFLNRTNVRAFLQQMRRKGVSQSVTRRALGNPARPHSAREGALHRSRVDVMSPPHTVGIPRHARSRKDIPPRPLAIAVRVPSSIAHETRDTNAAAKIRVVPSSHSPEMAPQCWHDESR